MIDYSHVHISALLIPDAFAMLHELFSAMLHELFTAIYVLINAWL